MNERRAGHRFFGIGCFLFAMLLVSALSPLYALEWSIKGDLLFIPEDNGLAGDPMPILPTAGVTVEYPLPYNLYLGAGYDLYSTYYGYSSTLGRAIPVAIENRSTLVIGNLLSLYGTYHLNIPALTAAGLRLRFAAGLSIDARLCLIADGLEGPDLEDASQQTAQVANYFWSNGRWLFPMTGFGIDFVKVKNVWLGLDSRVWYPLYRAWSGDAAPAAEGWRYDVGIRISF
ncbi:MAG: hypothetical protein ACOZCE_13345 [Spirochaetota bacterium]|nr:hypothetical protein [Treponema sp.]